MRGFTDQREPRAFAVVTVIWFISLASSRASAQDWVWQRPRSPGPLLEAEAAYDSVRQRTVMFGGLPLNCQLCAEQQRSETWEWNGALWTRRDAGTPVPSGRRGHSLVYDAARQRTLLFGGGQHVHLPWFRDTWLWDGHTWTQVVTNNPPPMTYRAAAAYDAARQQVVVVAGDMWTWDGVDWARVAPAVRPIMDGVMADDPTRQRLVFIGSPSQSPTVDTWEWDGVTWSRRLPSFAPPASTEHRAWFDVARRRVVLFDAQAADLRYEWDGTTWVTRSTGFAPTGRLRPAVAYDAVRQRMLLFGGLASGAVLGDTWELDTAGWALRDVNEQTWFATPLVYDSARARVLTYSPTTAPQSGLLVWTGAAWVPRLASLRPTAHHSVALAFDAARARTVLFGGSDNISVRRETWEYDGIQWQIRRSSAGPAGPLGAVMAFDAARARTVLFGGSDGSLQYAETWEWDGLTWQQRVPATSPSARTGHVMVFDPVRRRVVLFGGRSAALDLGDTWEFDGSTWIAAAQSGPSPRTSAAAFFDPRRARVVLVGGSRQNIGLRDVWEWDGIGWTQVPSVNAPLVAGGGAAFDVQRGYAVTSGDGVTWLLGRFTPARAASLGPGCPASARLFSNDPYLGSAAFSLDVLGARANAPCGIGLALAAQAQPIGPCTLYLRDLLVWLGAATNAQGAALLPMRLPADPALRGVTLHAQAFIADPNGGAFGLAWSNGWRLGFGD